MKKLLSTILAIALTFTAVFTLVGCQKGEAIDPNRTQIYVSVQSIGVGDTFLTSLKQKYEAYNPKAQIMPVRNGTGDPKAEIQSGGYDVYMFTNCNIADYVTWSTLNSDYFVDITDIVTAKPSLEEKSIHERLFDGTKDYFNIGTEAAPKYIGLPWFDAYYGSVYDVDLFEQMHYFSTDPSSVLSYEGYDGIMGTEDDNWGPDGKEGSFDDGLPATYGDLKQLWLVMKEDVTPYCWTSFKGYSQGWLSSVWVAYEGQNYKLMTDFNGNYYTTNADPLEVNSSNGYLMSKQWGKLAALKVAEDIIGGSYYLPASLNTSQDNILSQTSFLESVESSRPIAMMMEGTWWENEAKGVFNEMSTFIDEKYAYGTRRFGLMPFPRMVGEGVPEGVPQQWNEKVSIRGGDVGSSCSMVAISKKSKNIEMAKDFVKFAYSEAMCADFNIESGTARPIEYEMSATELSKMTYYQQQVHHISQLSKDPNSNVEIVSGQNRSKYITTDLEFINKISTFVSRRENVSAEISNPFEHFASPGAMTAEEYFNNVELIVTKALWDNKFGNI